MPGRNRTFGLNSLGFLVVTLAAYFSAVVTMGYMLNHIRLPRAVMLISLALAYLINGLVGYVWARNGGRLTKCLVYLASQIIFGALLLFLARSPVIMFALLPLAGQAVVLVSRQLILGVCAVMWLSLVVPMIVGSGWRAAAVVGIFFLAGIVFVVVVTDLAVREQRARNEVERLVSELKNANEQLRQYADQVAELATLKERNRLAREIHDSLGHYLTVIIVQLEAAMAVFENDRERSLDGVSKAQALAQKGLTEVRGSVGALRASPGVSQSLIDSLRNLFDECRASKLAIEFRLNGHPRSLSPSAELALYRAAQEGLTNVRKHSHAQAATVILNYAADSVSLSIQDGGVGATNPKQGYGLIGMKERLQTLGGELNITSAANRGFTLEVVLPE